jgi:hypothetical protein
MFPRHRRPLMVCVILPALGAPLVSRIRQPAERSLLELAASLVAVALAPVIRPTDVEPDATSVAVQREDNELVHPARTDENWTATSASSTVPAYWLSIRRLYTRVQAATWTLLSFSAIRSYRIASSRASSWCVATGPGGDHFYRDHRGPRPHLLATCRRSTGAVKGTQAPSAASSPSKAPAACDILCASTDPEGGVHRRRTRTRRVPVRPTGWLPW